MFVDAEQRVRDVERVVRRSPLAWLAPIVRVLMPPLDVTGEPLEDRLDPAARRRWIERHLAFSVEIGPSGLLWLPLPLAIAGGISLATEGLSSQAATLLAVGAISGLVFVILLARQTAQRMRQAMRSVVVPARVHVLTSSPGTVIAEVTYDYAGVRRQGRLPMNLPASCIGGETVALLVDPMTPVAFFLWDLFPEAGSPLTRSEGHFETASIRRRVQRAFLPKLAPLIDLVARRGRNHPALRPTTAKVLAFDAPARFPAWLSLVAFAYATAAVVQGGKLLASGNWSGGFYVAGAVLATMATTLAAAVAIARRVRELDGIFARCAMVRGHVTAATRRVRTKAPPFTDLDVTIAFQYGGATRSVTIVLGDWAAGLAGWAPEILVDPSDPALIFLRDLYV